MKGYNLIKNIIGGVWMIDKTAAEGYLPSVIQLLSGQEVTDFHSEEGQEERFPFATAMDEPENRIRTDFSSTIDVPEGSIAVIPVKGALMKEDYCGEPGTATMGKWLKNAENNPNVIGVILVFDSPGGTVDGTEDFAEIIKDTTKPVVSYIDGIMASAAYWLGSQSDHIISHAQTDMIGSIGTMIQFADYTQYYEKWGIKIHDINADKSKDKNRVSKEAKKGNYRPIKQELLNPLNEVFLNAVKSGREGKLVMNGEEPLTGKVYLSSNSVENGLIDQVGSFQDAIDKVNELSSNNNQINMFEKFKSLTAVASKLKKGEAVTSDDMQAVNDELQKAGVTSLIFVESDVHNSLSEQNQSLTEANTSLNSRINAAVKVINPEATEEEIDSFDLGAEVGSIKKDLSDAKAKIAKYDIVEDPEQDQKYSQEETEKPDGEVKKWGDFPHNQLANQQLGDG